MTSEAIITIILTIIFGIPSLVALFQSFPSRIIFVIDEKIDVYKEISKTFKELEITYKGKNIEKNHFLLKGCFFYKGRSDIEKQQVKMSTYIEIPHGSIWYDCKIIATSKDLLVEPVIDKSKLIFNFDLLKNGEYYYFQAFTKVEIRDSNSKIFSPNHRIANVSKDTTEITYRSASTYKINAIGFLLMSLLTLTFLFFDVKSNSDRITENSHKVQRTVFVRDKRVGNFILGNMTVIDTSRYYSKRLAYLKLTDAYSKYVLDKYKFANYFSGFESAKISIEKDIVVKFTILPIIHLGHYLIFFIAVFGIVVSSVNGLNSYRYGEVIRKISDIKRFNDI